jgi:hypothetical protein
LRDPRPDVISLPRSFCSFQVQACRSLALAFETEPRARGKMTRDGSRASNVFRSRRRRSRHARACIASRNTVFLRARAVGSCHQHGSATVRDCRLATVFRTSRVARGDTRCAARCPCPIYTKCTHTKNGSPPHEEPVLTRDPLVYLTFLRDFHLLPPWPRGRKKKPP